MTGPYFADDRLSSERAARRSVLAIDTCFAACSVAIGLFNGDELVRIVSRFEPMQAGQAERIMPMVAEVAADAGISLPGLGLVAVTVGPGSFTGTRIGLAAAKGLALAIGAPTAGVTSLQVIAVQLAQAGVTLGHDFCVAVDMGRPDIYLQIFDKSGFEARTPAQLVGASDVDRFADAHSAIVVGHGPVFAEPGTPLSSYFLPQAETVVALVTQYEPKILGAAALYLRAPDAKPSVAGAKRTDMGGADPHSAANRGHRPVG